MSKDKFISNMPLQRHIYSAVCGIVSRISEYIETDSHPPRFIDLDDPNSNPEWMFDRVISLNIGRISSLSEQGVREVQLVLLPVVREAGGEKRILLYGQVA